MPQMFYSDVEFFKYSFVFCIVLGYMVSFLPAILCIYIRILFARHYNIKEILKVSAVRIFTLGLLLAAPASFFLGKPYMKFIQIPIYTILAIGIDYILTILLLSSYSKKIIFKFILYSNLVILIPSLLLAILVRL